MAIGKMRGEIDRGVFDVLFVSLCIFFEIFAVPKAL